MHDFLIIGMGVAGTSLAKTLIDAGADVMVVNHEDASSSSNVAAGLLNPITGRKFSLTWEAVKVFSTLETFYGKIQTDHNSTFFHSMPIYRICASMRELNDWSAKAAEPDYSDFVMDGFEPDPAIIDARWGTIGTSKGGYVNIPVYLELVKKELGERYMAVDSLLKEDEIEVNRSFVEWNGLRAKHLILCEGYLAYKEKFFGHLPFTPMKGEILELDIPGLYRDRILIRSGFIVPFGEEMFLGGATYDWRNINANPTREAREQILERLSGYIKTPIKVIGHRAAIRPAVKDRKPVIGTHHKYGNVHLFNGMGSKGTSLSPFLADKMVAFLLYGGKLPEEADLNRFAVGKSTT